MFLKLLTESLLEEKCLQLSKLPRGARGNAVHPYSTSKRLYYPAFKDVHCTFEELHFPSLVFHGIHEDKRCTFRCQAEWQQNEVQSL